MCIDQAGGDLGSLATRRAVFIGFLVVTVHGLSGRRGLRRAAVPSVAELGIDCCIGTYWRHALRITFLPGSPDRSFSLGADERGRSSVSKI